MFEAAFSVNFGVYSVNLEVSALFSALLAFAVEVALAGLVGGLVGLKNEGALIIEPT